MRNRVFPCLSIGVLLLASTSWAKQIEVFPVGLYPDDVQNVQKALDSFKDGEYGVLILKARTEGGIEKPFDFGQDPDPLLRGYVTPSPLQSGRIEFRGERTSDVRTVVLGGWTPIFALRHDAIIVRNIEFRGPFTGAIWVSESTDIVIANNTILDSVGYEDRCCTAPIAVIADVDGSLEEITGRIVIERNEIHGATGYFPFGIQLNSTNARTLIADNIVTGVNIGVQLLTYQKGALIRGNILETATTMPDLDAGGVVLLPGTQPSARAAVRNNRISVTDPFEEGAAYVAGLTVIAADYLVGGDFHDSEIADNELWLTNSDGIHLWVDTSAEARSVVNNLVAHNRMHGDSNLRNGIEATVLNGVGQITGNRFRYNDVSGLVNPGGSDLWLGPSTRGNLAVVGPDNDVMDLGTDNAIVVRP